MLLSLSTFLICIWTLISMTVGHKSPHIIFFLADDMGWNDVSYHGSPQIPTPNIDALAASGVILNSYYVASECTPSRASLLTGRHETKTGLQHYVIKSGEPTALPLEFKLMPEYFKDLGYATHMVGKWHLGYHKKEYTPTYRGFDSSFGYWNGQMDYYDHTNSEATDAVPGQQAMWGTDLHNGTETVRDCRGKYAQDLFAEKAVEIIENHNQKEPLFLYMSNIATHTGNAYEPIQATPERVAKYDYIENPQRREFAGVVSSLDESLGTVMQALNKKDMLNNTIIVFSSDNGGEVNGSRGAHGSNWPLRGMKLYMWEGGIRAPAVIWSPLFKLKKPRVSNQLMHISDWLPTLYCLAGGHQGDLDEIDGMDMSSAILKNYKSPRREIVIQLDPIFNMSGLRLGNYKLVLGTYPEADDKWFGPSGRDEINATSMDNWVWKDGSIVKDILQQRGWWLINVPDQWRKDAVITCTKKSLPNVDGDCKPKEEPCLYNIVEDPCEYHNLAREQQKRVRSMTERLKEYAADTVYPLTTDIDPHADPRCHGFAYVPWMDEEHASDCPWISRPAEK